MSLAPPPDNYYLYGKSNRLVSLMDVSLVMVTYFFCLISLSLIVVRLSTSADGLCFVGCVASKYSRSCSSWIA